MTIVVGRTPQHAAAVVAVQDLTARMRRVSLDAPALVATRPAQDVELILRAPNGSRVKRRYTIRNASPDGFDIDVLLHGDGPGSQWAATVAPGDTVELAGPRGKLALTGADWHLFVGDEAALPAIAEIVAVLPETEQAIVFVETDTAADELAIGRPHGELEVHWLHRSGRPPGTPDLLAAGLDALATPAGRGHGYLLGESRAVVALRPHVQAHGLRPDRVFLKGYWNVGRTPRRP